MRILLLGIALMASNYALAALPPGHAEFVSSNKKLMGHVELTPVKGGVKIVTTVSGMKPKEVLGYHIHEAGKCDLPSFESAGGHLNPEHTVHGSPTGSEKHVGDLGNLVANDKGVATSEVILKDVPEKDLKMIYDKAFVIHDQPDDSMTQPSGGSGKRIACGVLKTDKA